MFYVFIIVVVIIVRKIYLERCGHLEAKTIQILISEHGRNLTSLSLNGVRKVTVDVLNNLASTCCALEVLYLVYNCDP